MVATPRLNRVKIDISPRVFVNVAGRILAVSGGFCGRYGGSAGRGALIVLAVVWQGLAAGLDRSTR
jgi:hypothetical protein